MPSKRYDFTVADGLFPGEDVNLEWTLYERDASGAFVEVSDMTNREFTLYVLDHPRQPETEARLKATYDLMVTSGVLDPSKVDFARTYSTEFVRDLRVLP